MVFWTSLREVHSALVCWLFVNTYTITGTSYLRRRKTTCPPSRRSTFGECWVSFFVVALHVCPRFNDLYQSNRCYNGCGGRNGTKFQEGCPSRAEGWEWPDFTPRRGWRTTWSILNHSSVGNSIREWYPHSKRCHRHHHEGGLPSSSSIEKYSPTAYLFLDQLRPCRYCKVFFFMTFPD